ncbi:MAG: hypothetical protein MK085_02285 [Phycisphaerales bacterium]|nr:hypothetical protein [Phycisphaerales bacterium]
MACTNLRTRCLFILTSSLITTAAAAQAPDWEDQTLGDTFFVGQNITASGIDVTFHCFDWAPPAGTTCNGQAVIDDRLLACGSGYDLNLNNINVRMNFAGSGMPQTDLTLLYGEYGGNVNLRVNGDARNVANFSDLHGTVVGGTTILVNTFPGSSCGEILFQGLTNDLLVGGQELWIDAKSSNTPDDCDFGYEDLNFGDLYPNGSSFVTDGLACEVKPIEYLDGSFGFGEALVDASGMACDSGNEIFTNNCVVKHDFAGSVGPYQDVTFKAGEYGGIINVVINGDHRVAWDYSDLDGLTIGGVLFTVTSGGSGQGCTEVALTGVVYDLGLGGQEHWIDCINGNPATDDPNGECEDAYVDYDDMSSSTTYGVGDSTTTSGIAGAVDIRFLPQTFSDGTTYSLGSAIAQPVGLSCGDGLELQTYAIAALHDFAGSIGSLVNVKVKVADHGGEINFAVNGSPVVAANTYADIDGITIAGCTLSVISGGGMGECTQLYISGQVDSLLLGGGQHMIDCIEAEDIIAGSQPGDLNGDNVINGADMGLLLAAWGGPDGDLDGDGNTDGADLGLMLALWTN